MVADLLVSNLITVNVVLKQVGLDLILEALQVVLVPLLCCFIYLDSFVLPSLYDVPSLCFSLCPYLIFTLFFHKPSLQPGLLALLFNAVTDCVD